MPTTMLHIRIDEHLKDAANETLASMGLSLSDAVRVFLTRVVAEQQIPFSLKVPNAETREAMEEARSMTKARFTNAQDFFHDIEKASQH